MEPQKKTVLSLFKDLVQYHIPFYQRAYTWDQTDQWEPLLLDAQDRADLRLQEPNTKPRQHFLGAMVVKNIDRRNDIGGISTTSVIDGQQRLTTLQFLLTGIAMAMRELGADDQARQLERHLANQRDDGESESLIYKIWPTQQDRDLVCRALRARSRDELYTLFTPEYDHCFKKDRQLKVHHSAPKPLAAVWYFCDQAIKWAQNPEEQSTPVDNAVAARRLSALASAVLNDFLVFVLFLDDGDDPQVIFETLNGRGAHLTAVDLIRNYVFLSAEQQGEKVAELFESRWRRYDDPWWKAEVSRGRLKGSQLAWFLRDMLAAETHEEIEMARVYHEYQQWSGNGVMPASQQLAIANAYSDIYRSLLAKDATPVGRFARRIKDWDFSTGYAVTMAIAVSNPDLVEQSECFRILESYIVRRLICGLKTKTYNQVFAAVLKKMTKGKAITAASLRTAMSSMAGENTRWPKDDEFEREFRNAPLYGPPKSLSAGEMRTILAAIENGLRTERSEEPNYEPGAQANVDVDHMMPTAWHEHWRLPGDISVNDDESRAAFLASLEGTASAKQTAINLRNTLIPTIGNLTLLHYGNNRSAQNCSFIDKKRLYLEHTNLHLNRDFMLVAAWDEPVIRQRAEKLFKVAAAVWPAPEPAEAPSS